LDALTDKNIHCPYCGESISILIDCTISQQDYIEDCQVCCRPIVIHVDISSEGEALVSVRHEDE